MTSRFEYPRLFPHVVRAIPDRIDPGGRQEVRPSDVGDVHVVPDAGAIWRVGVIAKEVDRGALTEGDLEQHRDQVGLRYVVLTQRSVAPQALKYRKLIERASCAVPWEQSSGRSSTRTPTSIAGRCR